MRTASTIRDLPCDISFLIADLRWNNGTLKILELGEGPQSFFQGFDKLFGTGKIWQSFWKYLHQFNLPIWYVGKKPNTSTRIKQFAFDEFLSDGGRWVPSLDALAYDEQFIKSTLPQTGFSQLPRITQHKGILVFSNHGYPNWYAKALKGFKEKYPGFLIINDVATPHVNHKYHTSILFDNNDLRGYRPRWIRCQKQYTTTLANSILHHLNAPIVVIKPLNAANGWGNLMVEAKDLDATLKKILTETEQLKDYNDRSWSYWAEDGHKHFLVEEFVTSHSVNFESKQFDGTMRMVFILKHEKGIISMNFLGCCWKLPALSLDQNGTIMKKHKSGFGATKVSVEDQRDVKSTLKILMPQLYKKMLIQKSHKSKMQ